MKAFYILKPDCLQRKEVLEYYRKLLYDIKYIRNIQQYQISSWKNLSCLIYEPNDSLVASLDIVKIRKQMLTTIKGYNIFYDDTAIINIFDVENDISLLKELEKIKYDIRKKFVLNTDKNYIKFLNLNDNDLLCNRLIDIDIDKLKVDCVRLNFDQVMEDENYKLAFFNCIHFPEPEVEFIEKDLDIIMSNNVLLKKL